MATLKDIRIGTLVKGQEKDLGAYLDMILPHGFESISVSFWLTALETDLKAQAELVKEKIAVYDCEVSSVSVFGNPLMDDEAAANTRKSWELLIDHTKDYGCEYVTGFSGRVVDQPVPDSIERYKEVFGPLADHAGEQGVKIAFENCNMGGDWNRGDWNIAFNPSAWELMFDALPHENIGLQWEPCHQMVQMIDPMPQLDDWIEKIFILHGKDASVYHDRLAKYGQCAPKPWLHHRHPGFGDSDWTAIISRLRENGFTGYIDIEGWHDPVYKGDLEIEGQVFALNYLKQCRGGNPLA